MRGQYLFLMASISCLSMAYAGTKLTPLKTGGARPLESLKDKKESSTLTTEVPSATEDVPPAPVFKGPTSGWGIVPLACPYYSTEGRNGGKIAAGTLFTYSGVKHSTKGFVLLAKIQLKEKTFEGPFLLEASDVVLYHGEFEKMSGSLIADIKTYYTIAGQIAERKEKIEEKSQSRNPHFDTAKLWQQRYVDSIEKAGKMEEKANALKGPAKSKMLDELRLLKYEQARLKTQADREALNYKAWKDQNPINPALLSDDVELKALQAQLKEAKEKVKNVVD